MHATSLLAVLLAAPPALTDGTVRGDFGKELDARFTKLVADGFDGVVLVVRDGTVVLAKGYGFADRARKVPFTTDTVFDVGSVTKPFTAAAVLKLEMQGKLKVTDPLTKFFKDVPDDKKGITLHHLLTHTAGFPDALGGDYEKVGRDEFLKLVLGTKLLSEPGKTYRYSNVGYSVLGAVVELVSGTDYETYLRENLFKPAGMERTGYRLPKWGKDDLARGYRKDKDWGTPRDRPWADDGPYWHLRANGGLLSSADDLYRWHLALSADEVLSKEAKAKHFFPHVKEGFGGSHYGYGWSISKSPRGTAVVEHNGSNGVFFCDVRRYPDEGGLLVLATTSSGLKYMTELSAVARLVFPPKGK